jgi:HK97 family phage prohead protease
MKDVPLKYNQQDNILVIARTRNRSLTLLVDDIGLKVSAKLIETSSNKKIYQSVVAGLLDKMNFAFTVKDQSWNREVVRFQNVISNLSKDYTMY